MYQVVWCSLKVIIPRLIGGCKPWGSRSKILFSFLCFWVQLYTIPLVSFLMLLGSLKYLLVSSHACLNCWLLNHKVLVQPLLSFLSYSLWFFMSRVGVVRWWGLTVLFVGARVLVSFILLKPITYMVVLFIFTMKQYYFWEAYFFFFLIIYNS